MYVQRAPEEIFKAANLAVSKKFFGNLVETSIKDVAFEAGVCEKQLHFWKNHLIEEGPKIFRGLKPGRSREDFSSFNESERLLVYESVNNLLVEERKLEDKRSKLSADFKERILRERDRLKEEFSLSFESFSDLVGIDSGSTRLWSRRVKQEGRGALEDRSRAPKRRPGKLHREIIDEIVAHGSMWKKRRRGKIRITEFAASFRRKYGNLLARYGKIKVSDKTIGKYLKEAGLYAARQENPKSNRGAFRYYFPGAQFLMDTTVLTFLGIKAKLISVMDALSRAIFHQQAFAGENAFNVIKSVRGSLKKARNLGVSVLSFLSDHGRPYKARSVRQYLKEEGCMRIFSPPYRPQGKAPIERYFRTVKEALSDRWEILILFGKGILVWIKERIIIAFLNLVLMGFNSGYEKTVNSYIDGKSPDERLRQGRSPEYREATRKVLEDRQTGSSLKSELIGSLHEEFGLNMPKAGAVKYLSRFRRQSIEEAAEALRRKLVVADLPPVNRWHYLSKVARNINEKKMEAELLEAKRVIRREEIKAKQKEEREKIIEDRRWYETHPQEALDEAVEWRLVFSGNELAVIPYRRMIADSLKRILMRYSSATSQLKVEKICERIQNKERLENHNVIRSGLGLPEGEKLKQAKEETVALIRESFLQCRQDIPRYRVWKKLWGKTMTGLRGPPAGR